MAIKKPPTWPAQIIVESTPEGPPTFAGIPISKGTASGLSSAVDLGGIFTADKPVKYRSPIDAGVHMAVTHRKPIRVNRGPPHPGPGWLFDEKGQPRRGACGHPVHWRWGCRICPLFNGDRGVQCYVRNEGRHAVWLGKYGGTPKKRRKANSYKPWTPDPTKRADVKSISDALQLTWANWSAFDGRAEVGPTWIRICPESSRTIRIRHGAYDEEDAIVIGEPWPQPNYQGIDELHAMIQNAGAALVHQQAQMTQNLIDFGNADGFVEGMAVDFPAQPADDIVYTLTVTDVTPTKK